MSGMKPSLAVGSFVVVALAAWAGGSLEHTGSTMVKAAARFVAALEPAQKDQAVFSFTDPERLNWHFIPRERKGLPIKAMSPEQRALAFGLIRAGLSQEGSLKATTIMSLEAILRDLEKGSGPVRDPELYYVSIFGDPSGQGRWGWRVEGHHLSLNFTLADGKVVSASPAFFGANPAEVRDGPRAGLRTLAELQDRALELVQALTPEQREKALVQPKAPGDIESNTGIGQQGIAGGLATRAPSDAREGIHVGELTALQKDLLTELIDSYALDMPDDVATAWLKEVRGAGEDLSFAWYGPAQAGQPHGYQIQGPTFQIEFNNTQNGANHIHSVWRATLTDFGQPAQ